MSLLFAAVLSAPQATAQVVRLGYIVPSDRTEQPGAVERFHGMALRIQAWYADQMDRYGFGRKTFELELQPGGITPRVHVVDSAMNSATIRTDTWSKTIEAATAGGLPIWTSGQVWLLSPFSHLQQANGAVIGGTALGASFGSGNDPGVAMIGSDFSFRSTAESLVDTRRYAGIMEPLIGPVPFVQGVTFPAMEGATVSSIASAAQGAAAHELGHAFGLAHDFRNDSNFDGNLMGNGLRGWRGSNLPDLFPQDDTQLSYAAAIALNVSRYFNTDQPYTDQVRPNLSINTSGAVDPAAGQLEVAFTASDNQGLSAALLRRNGETIGEMVLDGRSVASAFRTPYYTPGQNDEFSISVYDRFGNEREENVSITVATGFNRAPQPFIDLARSTVVAGESVMVTASQTVDPDGAPGSTSVEWDLDGDGEFDTEPSTTKLLTHIYDQPGDYLIGARLTDQFGAAALAAPLAVRVLPIAGDYNSSGIVDAADYTIWRDSLGQIGPRLAADGDRDGVITDLDYTIWRENFGMRVGGRAIRAAQVPEPGAGALLLLLGTVAGAIRPSRRAERPGKAL